VRTQSGKSSRVHGTSVATSVAAAIAGLLIGFSRHSDCGKFGLRAKLKTIGGISAVFKETTMKDGPFLCFALGKDHFALRMSTLRVLTKNANMFWVRCTGY